MLVVATGFMGTALLVQSVLSAVHADKANVNSNALNAQVAIFFVFNLFFVAVGYDKPSYPANACLQALQNVVLAYPT